MLRLLLTVLLAALVTGVAAAESYVVSPKATAETKAAVAAGRPPEHGFPEIHDVQFTGSARLHPGTSLQATVVTSDNVGYVEARIDYRALPMHQDGPGKFSLSYTVPWWLPWWLRHKWTLQIIARSVDGIETKQYLPIRVR